MQAYILVSGMLLQYFWFKIDSKICWLDNCHRVLWDLMIFKFPLAPSPILNIYMTEVFLPVPQQLVASMWKMKNIKASYVLGTCTYI